MVYYDDIVTALYHIFGVENVIREWDVAKDSRDAYTRKLYCPRIDIAVAPFNIDTNIDFNNMQISDTYYRHSSLIDNIQSVSDVLDQRLLLNENPRCFLAIEMENRSSRKHRLGSMMNASAMGKVGIIVAYSPTVFSSLVKIRKYLRFIEKKGKSTYKSISDPRNLMIVLLADFQNILNKYS